MDRSIFSDFAVFTPLRLLVKASNTAAAIAELDLDIFSIDFGIHRFNHKKWKTQKLLSFYVYEKIY